MPAALAGMMRITVALMHRMEVVGAEGEVNAVHDRKESVLLRLPTMQQWEALGSSVQI
jgi:hypothetical protein